jgi:hypothetical protein
LIIKKNEMGEKGGNWLCDQSSALAADCRGEGEGE